MEHHVVGAVEVDREAVHRLVEQLDAGPVEQVPIVVYTLSHDEVANPPDHEALARAVGNIGVVGAILGRVHNRHADFSDR